MSNQVKEQTQAKKPWTRPEFIVHGSVTEITLAPPCPWREKRWGGTDGVTFAGINIPIHCAS
jgi:hypothetical protein